MKIEKGENFRTIWLRSDDPSVVQIIDQTRLPHEYVVRDLSNYREGAQAIREMLVRGAPLIDVYSTPIAGDR